MASMKSCGNVCKWRGTSAGNRRAHLGNLKWDCKLGSLYIETGLEFKSDYSEEYSNNTETYFLFLFFSRLKSQSLPLVLPSSRAVVAQPGHSPLSLCQHQNHVILAKLY